MNANRNDRRARVILGATCYADAEAALQVATVLAQQLDADLMGCLVADQRTLASASGPAARTLAFSGRALREVDPQGMQSALRLDARLFEARLAEAARRASVAHHFQQLQGLLTKALDDMAEARDLLVYGFQRPVYAGDRVVLVLSEDRLLPELLAIAENLSSRLRRPLTIFAPPAILASLRQLPSLRPSLMGDLRPLVGGDDLLKKLDGMSPAALILGSDPGGMPSLPRLIESARCPVILPVAAQAAPPGSTASG